MATYEEIKKFWIESGKTELDKDGLRPTARDPYMQILNEHYIAERLCSCDHVLDIGCGEGTSSFIFSEKVEKLIGVDYSDTLINQARKKQRENLEFLQGDVLEIGEMFPEAHFDSIVSIRCLINLPEVEQQYRALDQLFHVLKPGGTLFLSEGYQAGWDGLNLHRQRSGLEVMKVVGYNRLFVDLELEKYLQGRGRIAEFVGFGEYLYGSRVVHPLLTDGVVRHDSHINKIFSDLHLKNVTNRSHSDCDYAGIYIVKKH